MILNIKTTALAIAAATLVPAAAMACPEWQGAPHFGSIELSAGFVPDPYVRSITAGGNIDLERCGLDAAGFVTQRPDFDLYWSGDSAQLTIAVQSPSADAVLLVSGPSGEWYYNDDADGTDPIITISYPDEGLYDIWIGTYDGSRRNPGNLIITEY